VSGGVWVGGGGVGGVGGGGGGRGGEWWGGRGRRVGPVEDRERGGVLGWGPLWGWGAWGAWANSDTVPFGH